MLYTIQNEKLTVSADTSGAELHSIRANGLEYLWQCGEAWKRYAPILFPFICSPENGEYRADGKLYKMKANHGFARDMEFTLTEQTADSLTFRLESNAETLAQYPYAFLFEVKYTLLKDGVQVEHFVTNTGDKTMYFYIGGHPAFNCPLEEGLAFTDYVVQYEKPEHLTRMIDGREMPLFAEKSAILPMSRELFDYDSLVLDAPDSQEITLRSEKSVHAVTVKFPESKAITVWSPTGDDRAAFVCLEPWTSVPVYYDDAWQNIEQKPHAIALEPAGNYCYAYSIHVQ